MVYTWSGGLSPIDASHQSPTVEYTNVRWFTVFFARHAIVQCFSRPHSNIAWIITSLMSCQENFNGNVDNYVKNSRSLRWMRRTFQTRKFFLRKWQKWKKRKTNDPDTEQFKSVLKEVEKICKLMAVYLSYGGKIIKDEIGLQIGETTVQSICRILHLTSIQASWF